MMKSQSHFLLIALITAGPLSAQDAEKRPEAAPEAITAVTVILRQSGSNIPGKFTSYLAGPRGSVTLPLHDRTKLGWIALIEANPAQGKRPPHFNLSIRDTSHLVSSSSAQKPLSQSPLEFVKVQLPLKFGSEIPVYKSPNLAVSILFESAK